MVSAPYNSGAIMKDAPGSGQQKAASRATRPALSELRCIVHGLNPGANSSPLFHPSVTSALRMAMAKTCEQPFTAHTCRWKAVSGNLKCALHLSLCKDGLVLSLCTFLSKLPHPGFLAIRGL